METLQAVNIPTPVSLGRLEFPHSNPYAGLNVNGLLTITKNYDGTVSVTNTTDSPIAIRGYAWTVVIPPQGDLSQAALPDGDSAEAQIALVDYFADAERGVVETGGGFNWAAGSPEWGCHAVQHNASGLVDIYSDRAAEHVPDSRRLSDAEALLGVARHVNECRELAHWLIDRAAAAVDERRSILVYGNS